MQPAKLPPIHLNTLTIKDASLRDKFRLARDAGFAGLEVGIGDVAPHLLTEMDKIEGRERYLLESNEVETDNVATAIAAAPGLIVDGVMPGTDVMMRWAHQLDDGLLQSLDETCRTCAELAGRYVVLPALTDDGTPSDIARNLREIGALARKYQVRLGLEPMGHARVVNTVSTALDVLDRAALGSGAGIILDAFHFFRAGEGLQNLASLPSDRIVAVQINDAISLPRAELFGNRHRTFPGRGVFNVVGFCGAVLERGYKGPFTIEVMNPSIWSLSAQEICREAFECGAAVLACATGSTVHCNEETEA